jgi:DHA1 family multidrug resistance protein-like MFS transporter
MNHWKKTLWVLFVVQLLTSIAFNVALPFLPLFITNLDRPLGGTLVFWSGLVFSVPAASMMIASPIWGWVADRHGRKPMLIRSTVAGAVVLTLMGFAQTVEQLTVLRLLQGLFTGYFAASNALVAAIVPREQSGAAFGLLRISAWLGAGLGPLVGGLVGEHMGYRPAFWITGGIMALATALVIVMINEDFIAPETIQRRGLFTAYASLLRAPRMIRIYAMGFLDSMARSIALPALPLFMLQLMKDDRGVSTATGVLLGGRALLAAMAAYAFGLLSDRMGYGRLSLLAASLLTVCHVPQPLADTAWTFMLLQLLSGIVGAAMIPTISALLTTTSPAGLSGATFGLDASIQSLARALGPMLAVAIAGVSGVALTFWAIALIYLVVALLGVGVDEASGRRRARRR